MKRSKKKTNFTVLNKPPRPVVTRQIARNKLKRETGSNRIRRIWEDAQIDRYGYMPWFNMRVACDPRNRDMETLVILYGRK